MAIPGLTQALVGMDFKKSRTNKTIGCNLTSNREAKMEIPADALEWHPLPRKALFS